MDTSKEIDAKQRSTDPDTCRFKAGPALQTVVRN